MPNTYHERVFIDSSGSLKPRKTLIVPAGTGANIALESSTDLTHWPDAVPGVYTNAPSNLFFRIKAERIP